MLKWWQSALIMVAGVAVAFAAGRYSKPARVEIREHETAKLVQDTTAQARVVELTAQLETLRQRQHTERVVVVHADGSRESRTVRDTDTERAEVQRVQVSAVTLAQSHTAEVHTVERSSVTEQAPAWSVGALLYFTPGAFRLANPVASLDAGVSIERRLWGPLYVGASATVPLAKPVSWPTLAVELGVSF